MKAINPKSQEALDAFYANPTWNMVYDAAPSDTAREFVESWFDYSHWFSGDGKKPEDYEATHKADKEDLYRRMTKQDFEFAASIAPHPKCREYYLKMAASAEK